MQKPIYSHEGVEDRECAFRENFLLKANPHKCEGAHKCKGKCDGFTFEVQPGVEQIANNGEDFQKEDEALMSGD